MHRWKVKGKLNTHKGPTNTVHLLKAALAACCPKSREAVLPKQEVTNTSFLAPAIKHAHVCLRGTDPIKSIRDQPVAGEFKRKQGVREVGGYGAGPCSWLGQH